MIIAILLKLSPDLYFNIKSSPGRDRVMVFCQNLCFMALCSVALHCLQVLHRQESPFKYGYIFGKWVNCYCKLQANISQMLHFEASMREICVQCTQINLILTCLRKKKHLFAMEMIIANWLSIKAFHNRSKYQRKKSPWTSRCTTLTVRNTQSL